MPSHIVSKLLFLGVLGFAEQAGDDNKALSYMTKE